MKKLLAIISVSLFLAALACGATFFLVGEAPRQKRLVELGHDGPVISLAFSPDSHYVVGGSNGIGPLSEKPWDGRIKVWGTKSLKPISAADFPRHVTSLAFSKNGKIIAVGSSVTNWPGDKKGLAYKPHPAEVRILSFPDLKEQRVFQVGESLYQVLFSDDGKFVAASSFSGEASAVMWSVSNWKKVREMAAPHDRKLPIARSSNGHSFLRLSRPADAGGLYRIMTVRPDRQEKDDKALVTFDKGHTPSQIESIAQFVDKKHVIYHAGGPIRLVSVENGNEDTPEALALATGPLCRAYTVSADGKWLACIVRRSTLSSTPVGAGWIVLWDLENQKQLTAWAWPEERLPLLSIAISPNKKMLAVGTPGSERAGVRTNGEVVLYDISAFIKK